MKYCELLCVNILYLMFNRENNVITFLLENVIISSSPRFYSKVKYRNLWSISIRTYYNIILLRLFYVFRTKYLTVYDIRPLMSYIHRFPICTVYYVLVRVCVCVSVCVPVVDRIWFTFRRWCSPEQYRSRFIIQQTVRICFLMETKHIHARRGLKYTRVYTVTLRKKRRHAV